MLVLYEIIILIPVFIRFEKKNKFEYSVITYWVKGSLLLISYWCVDTPPKSFISIDYYQQTFNAAKWIRIIPKKTVLQILLQKMGFVMGLTDIQTDRISAGSDWITSILSWAITSFRFRLRPEGHPPSDVHCDLFGRALGSGSFQYE